MAALLQSRAQEGHELVSVVGLPAGNIRSASVGERKRAYCVVDDTEEAPGVHHPAHAAVGCCLSVPRSDLEALAFMEVFDAVYTLYSKANVWAKAS